MGISGLTNTTICMVIGDATWDLTCLCRAMCISGIGRRLDSLASFFTCVHSCGCGNVSSPYPECDMDAPVWVDGNVVNWRSAVAKVYYQSKLPQSLYRVATYCPRSPGGNKFHNIRHHPKKGYSKSHIITNKICQHY